MQPGHIKIPDSAKPSRALTFIEFLKYFSCRYYRRLIHGAKHQSEEYSLSSGIGTLVAI